jgi:hypothetical protein
VNEMAKILGLIPIGFLVVWVYEFFTWFVPLLSTPFGKFDWTNLSLWGIIAPILFIIVGVVLVVASFIVIMLWLFS